MWYNALYILYVIVSNTEFFIIISEPHVINHANTGAYFYSMNDVKTAL